MYNKPEHAQTTDSDDEAETEHAEDADETEARTREEAAADWMVAQGFDRKE